MTYRVNSPHVISETVGGETIIVNLASGHYFSLQGTAVEVWKKETWPRIKAPRRRSAAGSSSKTSAASR